MSKSKTPVLCFDCQQPLPSTTTWHTSICGECRNKRRVAYQEEHSRIAPDGTVRKDKGWMIGDECQVKIGKVLYDAKILDMSDISRRESNHDLMMLELSKTVKGFGGEPYTQSWTHPDPVPSYRLRKRSEDA